MTELARKARTLLLRRNTAHRAGAGVLGIG